jgi:hypothetical protein
MMPVQPQPPVSFLAPYPAATPRSSLLIYTPFGKLARTGIRRTHTVMTGRRSKGFQPYGCRITLRPHGQVAQLVEQRTENPRVGGSIPSLAINPKK